MIYSFGDYELDLQVYQLRQAGKPLKVEPKVFNVLAYLVKHRDSVVPKDELLAQVWPDQYISEATLSGCIMAARKAVGDSGREQRVIQTAHGRGYRFVAPVIVEQSHEQPVGDSPVILEVPGQAASHSLQRHEAVDQAASLTEHGTEPLLSEHGVLPSPETSLCPTCQHENGVAATFCTACGTRLMQSCPQCKQPVRLPAAFCPACGQRLQETLPAIATSGEFPRSRFVGREQELALLHERFAQVASGSGQIVALVGESAIGKSWLLNEFRRSLRQQSVTYVEGRCLAYGRAMPYLPVRDIVCQSFGITETDTVETMTTKVQQHLQQRGMDPADGTPYLLHLLGSREGAERLALLSPETLRRRTFATVRQLLLACSRQRPLIVAIEDLHWLDPTSEEVLMSLIDSLANAPILLLATFRPEYQPAWLLKPAVTTIALPPLTPQDSLRLVQSVLPQERASAPLVQAILARAAGNPFFLEELSRAVIEQRVLESEVAMPDTIRGVLMARLDYLPDEPRRLLQTAAVFGRTFSARLLATIYEGPGSLDASLLELERRALCYEQRGAQEPVYVFKHELLQDVAYKSLLPARRQALHAAVAQALETLHADHLEDVDELLAYHYAQTAQAARSIESLRRAAEKATRSWAHAEAVSALQEALRHVERLPVAARDHCRLDLGLRQAQSLLALGRCRDAETLLLPQQASLTRLQDAGLAGHHALLLSQAAQHLGQWEQAETYAQHAVEAATVAHDDVTRGQAHQVLAMGRYWAGQPHVAIEHSQQAIALLEQSTMRAQLGTAHFVLGLSALLLGDFARALAAETQANTIGEASGELQLQAFAAWATGWIQATCGAWDEGIAACQRGLERAPDPLNAAFALGWLGYAYLERGNPEEALLLLEQASAQMHQFQYWRLEGLYTTMLGEAYLLRGDVDKACDLARQGLDIVTATAYRFGIGWAQRSLGKTCQAHGNLAKAETYFCKALDTFATMSARFELGRTHLARAALAQHQHDREAASTHITAAYHLFTASGVPTYVERTGQQAQALGLSLSSSQALT